MRFILVVALCAPAIASAEPLTLTPEQAPPTSGPAVTIQSPADLSTIETAFAGPSRRKVSDQTIKDPKAEVIHLKADLHGGNRVTLVVDGVRGLVLHDLSKTITIEDVLQERPIQGWHYLAAFASDRAGHAIGPVTVSRFAWSSKQGKTVIEPYIHNSLVIINRPLFGTYDDGSNRQQGEGTVVSHPEHASLELLMWTPPGDTAPAGCVSPVGNDRMALGDLGERKVRVTVPGRYQLSALEANDDGKALTIGQLECPKFTPVPMIERLQGGAIRMYVP